jgi:hypothetical protein
MNKSLEKNSLSKEANLKLKMKDCKVTQKEEN